MAKREQSSPEFSFSGFLLFRYLDSEIEHKFEEIEFNKLPEFSPGTTDQPGRGFEKIFSSIPSNFANENPKLAELVDNGEFLRYKSEIYGPEQEVVTKEGERMSAFTVSTSACDVIVTPSKNVFVRGSSKDFEKAIPEIRQIFTEAHASDFNPDFLLWVVWRYFLNEEIESANPLRLTDVEMEGSLDAFGQRFTYSGEDVTRSYPVIMGLLRGKEFSSIEGTFDFSGTFVKTKISSDGTIHIHAAEDIRHSNQFRRYLSAVDAADSLVSLYKRWTKLNRKERYPPESFYIDLRDSLEEDGVSVEFSISETLKRASELRK